MQIDNFIYNENNRKLICDVDHEITEKVVKTQSEAISIVTHHFRCKLVDLVSEAINIDPDNAIYNELYFRLINHLYSENWIDSLGFIINKEIVKYISKSHPDYELFLKYYSSAKTIYDHFIIHQNKPFKMIEKRSKQVTQLGLFN